jgi:transcription elongation GreA/GreB family factor
MAYGWSPKQMARVNARRQARGQEQLEFRPRSEKAASQYAEEYEQYGRRRKGIEEEDDEAQVVSKTPRLDELKARQGKKMGAKTPRLDRFKERLFQREAERGPQILASPFAKLTGGAV